MLEIEQVGRILRPVALLRHRALLRLIYCCELRLEEACRLTGDDIETGAVIVRDGKGGKERRVPLCQAVHHKLLRYWQQPRNPK